MPPYRIEWLADAVADIRAIDRATARHLFEGILRFSRTGAGDIKTLQGAMAGTFRLRLGDYRVLFTLADNTMWIFGVRHRSGAYQQELPGCGPFNVL